MNWAIITGAYPPDDGGMADYTKSVAESLAVAGDKVWVWSGNTGESFDDSRGIRVRRLPGHFGIRGLLQLSKELREVPQPRQIVIQHVPQALGPNFCFRKSRFRGLTLAFCLWLQLLREPAWVMFHELLIVASAGASLPVRTLAWLSKQMVHLIVRKCSRVFVSVPAWAELIGKHMRSGGEAEWLPVPSNVETSVDWDRVQTLRMQLLGSESKALIGHFGTFGPRITEILEPVIEGLLARDAGRAALLVGRGSRDCGARIVARHPELSKRVQCVQDLSASAVAEHLAACDLVVEPYPDGVSTRRSSTMAPLGVGLPIVCNAGQNTEPVWHESRAVALVDGNQPEPMIMETERLLSDKQARCELAGRAKQLYRERFSLQHTVEAMRQAANPSSEQLSRHSRSASPQMPADIPYSETGA